jgi:hypothetical protein
LGIGDPNFAGWLTVAAYLLASALAFRAGRSAEAADEARFWLGVAVALFVLGANKQLDLQTLATDLARAVSRAQGWYAYRRVIQAIFIAAVAIAAAVGAARLANRFRSSPPALKAAIGGVAFILAFIVIRAASFHHVDSALRLDFAGIRAAFVLELAGIAVLAASALSYRRRSAG